MSESDIQHQIEALERRLERRLNVGLKPITETLHRIETQTVKTNGRVTVVEQWRIETEARAAERAIAVQEAATIASEQARDAIASHDRSRRWWATVVALCFTAVSVGTPLMGALLRHLHVIHS